MHRFCKALFAVSVILLGLLTFTVEPLGIHATSAYAGDKDKGDTNSPAGPRCPPNC
jgi:hypothetical protein